MAIKDFLIKLLLAAAIFCCALIKLAIDLPSYIFVQTYSIATNEKTNCINEAKPRIKIS